MSQLFLHNRRRRSPRPFIFLGLVALGLLLLGGFIGMPDAISGFAQRAAIPLMSLRSDTVQSPDANFATSRRVLIEENTRLKQELEARQFDAKLNELLRLQNRQFKEALSQAQRMELTVAHILRRPPDSLYDTMVLNSGRVQGIEVGDLVVSSSVVLGVVRKVYDDTSTVVLFSSPGEETRVMIGVGASTTPVLATGMGGGNFEARIPREVEISEGDLVTLPTLDTYALSAVGEVIADASDSFQRVRFSTPINLWSLRTVYVVTDQLYE